MPIDRIKEYRPIPPLTRSRRDRPKEGRKEKTAPHKDDKKDDGHHVDERV